MKQKGTNKEIQKQLRRLTPCRPSEWYMHQAKQAIRMRPKKMQTVSSIAKWVSGAASDVKTIKIRAALYELCAQDEIAFMSKHFHVWDRSVVKERGAKQVFYSKENPYRAEILEDWQCDEEPEPQSDDIESMSDDELSELIDKAKKIQIKRGVAKRYACLSDDVQDRLVEVFGGIGITDPVYYAHSDDTISLLTYTAVQSMPIDVVIDTGYGPERLSCRHLTIFGKAILKATDSMFGAEEQ